MPETIGTLIKRLRKSAGMSQMKLAEKLNVSYQQVQKYEKTSGRIRVQRLVEIADALGVPVTTFMGDEKAHLIASPKSEYTAMSSDEVEILSLFRKVRDKEHQRGIVNMLKDLTIMSEKM